MSKLREAYELIRDPEHWCRGCAARDEYHLPVSPHSRRAVKWCALGAAWRFRGDETNDELNHLDAVARELFPELFGALIGRPLTMVNDRLGHDAVMQIYEKAIVEQEGSL